MKDLRLISSDFLGHEDPRAQFHHQGTLLGRDLFVWLSESFEGKNNLRRLEAQRNELNSKVRQLRLGLRRLFYRVLS